MKLEIKHLAPYLPYGLNVVSDELVPNKHYEMVVSNNSASFNGGLTIADVLLQRAKPVLRPLSDLIREIEINGEVFIPIEKMFGINYTEWDGESQTTPACVEHTYNCAKGVVMPKFLPNWVVENMYKWNFDVFELIPNGLAISNIRVPA